MLRVRNLRAGYHRSSEIVHGIDFDLGKGCFCCIIGANGCGKTTVLKTMLSLIPSLGGSIYLDERDTARMTERERARSFAYIPQTHKLSFPYQVKDVVLMGRTPHLGRLSRVGKKDRRIAYAALCQLSIEHLANKAYSQLSGGQQQLVLIARALTQQPRVLIMDEPTASLDYGNQQLVLSRMRSLVDGGMSVLMVTHDPAHAFYCADHVIALHDGRILKAGTPEEVITRETMRTIYGTEVLVAEVPVGNGATAYACIPESIGAESDPRFLRELSGR